MKLFTQRIEPADGSKFPAEREKDITASVCGALFGENDYTTHWQLWHRHANGMLGQPAGKLARFGNVLEPAIAELMETEHGCVLEKERGYIRCPDLRIGASLDYWCYKWEDNHYDHGIPLDCKLVSGRAWATKWDKGKVIPNQYVMQIQMQSALTGADRGLLGLLVAGEETHVFEVPFSQPLFDQLLLRVADFWKSIEEGREPLSNPDEDAQDLLRIYRRVEKGKHRNLDQKNQQAWELCDEYMRLQNLTQDSDEVKEALKRMTAIKAALFEMMKDAETATAGDYLIETKTVARKGYEVQPTEYRTLKIKG